jgi:hypothetical protein
MPVVPGHNAIGLASIGRIGADLKRPECVLANAQGDLYTADCRGGVAPTHWNWPA